MGRYSDDPLRHVITFRVNCEEKILLEQLAKRSGHNISSFLRRNLKVLSEARKDRA